MPSWAYESDESGQPHGLFRMVSATGSVQYGGPGLSWVSMTSAWPPAIVASTCSSWITSDGHQSIPSVSRCRFTDGAPPRATNERPPIFQRWPRGSIVTWSDTSIGFQAAALVLPAWFGPQLVEASPVLMIPVDAEELKLELGADRLDGGEVLLVVWTHSEPEVAQLTGHVHVAAFSQRSEAADGPVVVSLQVADQTDDHGVIFPGSIGTPPDHAAPTAARRTPESIGD
jgi:hypothetical protein